MRQPATQLQYSQAELLNHAIQPEMSSRKLPVIPITPCGIDVFNLEAGINMLAMPGTAGVIMPELKPWLQ